MSPSIYPCTKWIQERVLTLGRVSSKLCLLTKLKEPFRLRALQPNGVSQVDLNMRSEGAIGIRLIVRQTTEFMPGGYERNFLDWSMPLLIRYSMLQGICLKTFLISMINLCH